ncbi:hypothetical protein M9H77_22934 [Catharanthus roseus]|uniref:Uncharacterized protein n=1 Tax=Catharanthus roseus TaxID=4058 RepID=A0ACC0AS95_CATRO|nr:hypothetical protein M9H77_22934 [Catharanthus roseus]
MLCDSGYFVEGWVRRSPPARVAQGGLAGIDYRMPKLLLMTPFKDLDFCRYVLIRSNLPAAPKPFREFITCIQVIFMKLILFWHVKPLYKKYFTRMENTSTRELTGRPLLMLSKCFSLLSDDLVTRPG